MNLLYTIRGKKGDNELLMIPVYNAVVGEYLMKKHIEGDEWPNIQVVGPKGEIMFSK